MRRWVWVAAAVVVVLGAAFAWYMLKPVQGPARDLTLVGDATRGAYLLRLGGCVACHTDTSGGGGMLAGGPGGPGLTSPFGTFHAPNITSDPDAGLGRWTLAQVFERAERWRGAGGASLPGVSL